MGDYTDDLKAIDQPTLIVHGFWLEELAAPYYAFKDAGAEIVLGAKGSPGSACCTSRPCRHRLRRRNVAALALGALQFW